MPEKEPENKSPAKKRFVPKRLSKAEMDTITSQIDQRLHDFVKEGKYKDVLIAMGNLGKYSLNNQIYILMQMPEATTVHGMKKWNTLGRHVKPGSKSIKIFSPILKTVEEKVKDADGKDVVDKDGNPKKIRKQIVSGYEQGYVFDISQTVGKELNVYRFDETQVVENKDKILKGLRKVAKDNGFSISYATKEELGEGCYGLCNHGTHEIKILEGMSDLQEISTTVHECGHALAHSAYREDFEGLTPSEKREIKEIEAESIACVVCTFLGLDTQNFNFSYITGWADGDIDKFRENIDVISRHARTLIKGIQKEMVVEANKEKESGEVKAEGPATPPLQIPMPMIPEAKNQEIEMA